MDLWPPEPIDGVWSPAAHRSTHQVCHVRVNGLRFFEWEPILNCTSVGRGGGGVTVVVESRACPGCQRRGTLEHILSCCLEAHWGGGWWGKGLTAGITTEVLKVISRHHLERNRFHQGRVRGVSSSFQDLLLHTTGLLPGAGHWELTDDPRKQLKFPGNVACHNTEAGHGTALRSFKAGHPLENTHTVPWENNEES
ncbi:hypothetical protein NHX12_024845 [Muraenolepis orangiensis]|uniref:Uncharacterized protein n=1 Tax=Muraenolepis orangiensis TaxID=630683 RepID=A0A9Q0IR42_9TELE|nr:hypothetical protein NHX12_024845 [Muraenolepis orangiensis]